MLIESIDGPLVRYTRRPTPILAEPEEIRSVPDPQQFDAALNNVTGQPRNVTNPAAVNPREGVNSISQANEVARRDLQQDTDGQIDYTILPNDNLWQIGERYGRSLDEIEVANPDFFPPDNNPNIVQPGQVLTILNDDRTRIAVELAEETDPSRVRSLVTEDLQYATNDTPTPGDQLADAQTDLLSHRAGDAGFAQIVEEQGAAFTDFWETQGRTHEVWDPILDAAGRSDWQGVGDIVRGQLNAVSETSPTLESIAARRDMLLAYGPSDQAFGDAVNQTYQRYVVDEPEAAAQQVEDAYRQGGAVGASQTLRDLTNPEATNPLQAALIAKAALPTISSITSDFVDRDLSGPPVINWQDIYRNLSATAESINPSPQGQEVIGFMADTLREFGAPNIDARGAAEEGSFVLSQQIAERLRRQGNTERADEIANDSNGIGHFFPGLGVRVDEDTYLRSPTYELDEPGKIYEVLTPNGGTISVYVGSGVDFWQRDTDFGPTRSPSEVLARGPSSGRQAGGSTAEHDPLYNAGLRIPIEPRGALSRFADELRDRNSASNSANGAPGSGFEISPALTLGVRTYEQGDENGLQIQGFLTPEFERELQLGEVDDVFGRALVDNYPLLLRHFGRDFVAATPLTEGGLQDLQNNQLDQTLTGARVLAILEPYLSNRLGRDAQVDMSTRLGVNPTLTVDYFAEGDALFDESVSTWLQESGENSSELSNLFDDYLFQPVPEAPGISLLGPSFQGPRIAGELLSGAGEIAEGVPEINLESRQELAFTIGASGYLFFNEKSAGRGIPNPPLTTGSLLNSSIGVTASASLQIVYEPPVELTTSEITDIRNQAPVPFERGTTDGFGSR